MRESQYLSDNIVCPRCEQSGTRAIGRAICTSCYNKQEREAWAEKKEGAPRKKRKIGNTTEKTAQKKYDFGKFQSMSMRPQV